MPIFHPAQNPIKPKGPEFGLDLSRFRPLTLQEVSLLKELGNTAEDWESIYVSGKFYTERIRNCTFTGTIYLEANPPGILEDNDLILASGIYNSHLDSCYIESNCAIYNVAYLCGYHISPNCILQNIQQIYATSGSSFGCGFQAKLNPSNKRTWLEPANENGGRALLIFPKMLPADAYLWTTFGTQAEIRKRLIELTDNETNSYKDFTATVHSHTIIQNCSAIKNAHFGSYCSVSGAAHLENITICSSETEPSFIGSGVDLRNGIVGLGNHIDSNVIADHFMTGKNVNFKLGARVIHSFVGDNSTISCAEVLNNLIFPFHEQHHNNSFLIASTVMGQSNIAAGATIGSNHNSRAADGEIIAKRGFWPGLVTNFKHNSIFASFTLAAKGNYENELKIDLPFSLISPDNTSNSIRVFPGFWFKYNLYALARNSWKFIQRDKRKIKVQLIETDFLAPDTIDEMMQGIDIIRKYFEEQIEPISTITALRENSTRVDQEHVLVLTNQMLKGRAEILKPAQSILLYYDMALFYVIRTLLDNFPKSFSESGKKFSSQWINLGGQIVADVDLKVVLNNILKGKINSWDAVHQEYEKIQNKYVDNKYTHALATLYKLAKLDGRTLNTETVKFFLGRFTAIGQQLIDWVWQSRSKDYSNPWRKMVYTSEQQMEFVLGKIEDNPFLSDYQQTMQNYIEQAQLLNEQIG